MECIGNDKSRRIEDNNTRNPLPPGKIITPELSPVLGDVVQSWNFLSCFHKVLGLEKCLSLEELTTELTGQLFGGLSEAQVSMLRILLDETPVTSKCGKSDVPVLNVWSWPELARRYFLFQNGGLDSSHVHEGSCVKRCLYGDGGPALSGLAGLKLDTWLLAQATQKVYGCLDHDEDMMFIDDIDSESGNVCRTILEIEEIPDWVKELEPIKKLQTNVGSRIRNCIRNSIEKGPPKWAKDELERSISKEVYKSNASGPTKNAALNVVAHFQKMQKRMWAFKNGRNLLSISDVVLRKCRILFRRSINTFARCTDGKALLDFRIIDMRLGTGAYCGSHQAFAEDFHELQLCSSLSSTLANSARKFEQEYNKEVVGFRRKLLTYSKLDTLTPDLKKEVKDLLASTLEIPKVIWDEDLCRVCGMNEKDDKVLLCDNCDAPYHTYCLIPRLAGVPKGSWFCPRCIAITDVTPAPPNASRLVSKHKMKKGEHFMNLAVTETSDLATKLQDHEYWELTASEKTRLLKFFCDELLNSTALNRHMEKLKSRSLRKCPFGNEFLGEDSAGRLYWKLYAGSTHCIVVNERSKTHQDGSRSYGSVHNCSEKYPVLRNIDDLWVSNNSEQEFIAVCEKLNGKGSLGHSLWVCYHTAEEINRIMDFIRDDKSVEERLAELIFRSCRLKHETPKISKVKDLKELKGSSVKLAKDLLGSSSGTKARESLHSKFGSFVDIDMNMLSGQQNDNGKVVAHDNMYRCECLEPIIPRALHCFRCHETCITNHELRLHGGARCNTSLTVSFHNDKNFHTPTGEGTSGVSLEEFQKGNSALIAQNIDPELDIGNLFKVPLSSEKSLTGKSLHVLKHLKICLLDMEAALCHDAFRLSRACTNRKRAWHAFVKKVDTIYEMVQAMIVFEDMIKPDYLDLSWRNWSSTSAAAKISTLAALSLRLYSLDASLCYETIPCASDPLKLQSTPDKKNRKQDEGSTARKRRKLTET